MVRDYNKQPDVGELAVLQSILAGAPQRPFRPAEVAGWFDLDDAVYIQDTLEEMAKDSWVVKIIVHQPPHKAGVWFELLVKGRAFAEGKRYLLITQRGFRQTPINTAAEARPLIEALWDPNGYSIRDLTDYTAHPTLEQLG